MDGRGSAHFGRAEVGPAHFTSWVSRCQSVVRIGPEAHVAEVAAAASDSGTGLGQQRRRWDIGDGTYCSQPGALPPA